jgi:hypothetical protein
VVKCLPSKCKALSSYPSMEEKKKEEENDHHNK